eukprot:5026055-Heterocapsa_arctica.AAC.1
MPSSSRMFFTRIASFAASLKAKISASQLLSAMLHCVLNHDAIKLPCTKMHPPLVLLLVGPAAQLLSEKTLISFGCS